ncbi:MAG: MFS transporter [Burkholderiaceae bacterium]
MSTELASSAIGPTRRRWVVLCLLFGARTGLGYQFQSLASLSEPLIVELGFDHTTIGSLIGLFMLAGILLSFPAGLAARLASDRAWVVFGLIALAGGGALAAWSGSYGSLAIARLLCGVGFVFGTVYLTKMVGDWFEGRELATAMSVLVMSWPIGIALGQVLHPWIAVHLGWRAAFMIAGAYCLVAAAVVAIAIPSAPTAGNSLAGGARLAARNVVLTLLAAVVYGLFNASYVIYLSFAPLAIASAGVQPLAAAAIASVASWIMIVSAIVAGRFADATGRSDVVIYIGSLASMASLLALGQPGLSWPAVLLFGLVGAAPAGVIMSLTVEAMPAQARALGMGLFYTVFFLLMTVTPPLAGRLMDGVGTPAAPLALAAALVAGAALACVCFRFVQRLGRRA